MSKIEVRTVTAANIICDDCEADSNNRARVVIIGAGSTGHLYLCRAHYEQYLDDAKAETYLLLYTEE